MVTADEILAAVKAAGLPIVGVSIGDFNDPNTWRFDSTEPLTDEQAALAIATVQDTVLVTGDPIILPPTPTTTDVDDVVRWVGTHFGQTLDEAKTEIAKLATPIIIVPPPPP